MLESVVKQHGLSLGQVVGDAIRYFQRCQQPDGSIAEDPEVLVFQEWDSVNALKAIAMWHDRTASHTPILAERIVSFLSTREKPTGMLSWGAIEVGPDEYCTETSSEYIAALTLLGRVEQARQRADFLRSKQLASGPWEEVHSHIPKAFQAEPSVTGFALMALTGLDEDPLHLDAALNFLAEKQHSEGHFGINWYYYGTHYYLMRPAVAALASFGNYPAVAAARDFVLAQQRADGSWYSEVPGFGDMAAAEQHTALALATLAYAGLTAEDPPVRRAIGWLLARRRADGSWFGGRYPYPETESYSAFRATQDVFTTAQVLAAFKELEMA
ncbi:prenyltransferase/squalene oxidase repeat-containing protein [Nocardia sp. NPDC057455]|uniref:prenyltransferase/squalene oxidase repeat-containing protein n=1 Tax=Nocardia sp. NPDC057455 TaxID=3346138 RepID=UPI00366D1972